MSRKLVFVVLLILLAAAAGAYVGVMQALQAPDALLSPDGVATSAAGGALGGGVLVALVAYVFAHKKGGWS